VFLGVGKSFYVLSVHNRKISGMYYFLGSDIMAREYDYNIVGQIDAAGASAAAEVSGNADGTNIDYRIELTPTADGTGLQYIAPTYPFPGPFPMQRVSIGECT
jgi:hypothetical protein